MGGKILMFPVGQEKIIGIAVINGDPAKKITLVDNRLADGLKVRQIAVFTLNIDQFPVKVPVPDSDRLDQLIVLDGVPGDIAHGLYIKGIERTTVELCQVGSHPLHVQTGCRHRHGADAKDKEQKEKKKDTASFSGRGLISL